MTQHSSGARAQLLAFTGGTLDRQSEKRGEDCIVAALDDPAARVLMFSGNKLVLRDAASGDNGQELFAASDIAFDPASALYLGRDAAGAPRLAAQAVFDPDALPSGLRLTDLRGLIAQGLVTGPALGDIAYAAALMNWHRANRFCARCGHANDIRAGGAKRGCPNCGAEHFPRNDPVAIMLVTRGDRCLLGRGPHFPPGMVSCLAGFIEPGETIEDAVRRETFEESGIPVGAVRYLSSQPWPMPHSLMIGCAAEALTDDINHDAEELELCRWFTRDEVRAMLAGTHGEGFTAPMHGAIARHLMEGWAFGQA
ncbi:MAG: NAD(+) diphosphatase [Rhizobiaceae bacterium]|nr:NAD(+) diphosphatase [Rhizobiaceae bacterium]